MRLEFSFNLTKDNLILLKKDDLIYLCQYPGLPVLFCYKFDIFLKCKNKVYCKHYAEKYSAQDLIPELFFFEIYLLFQKIQNINIAHKQSI